MRACVTAPARLTRGRDIEAVALLSDLRFVEKVKPAPENEARKAEESNLPPTPMEVFDSVSAEAVNQCVHTSAQVCHVDAQFLSSLKQKLARQRHK